MPHRRKLRSGFTTGTAAAVSAKAAMMLLVEGKAPDSVRLTLPGGDTLKVPINGSRFVGGKAECTVIKDAGDDPDVTHRAVIGARVWMVDNVQGSNEVFMMAGEGVGIVTKPGLEVGVGKPAINPVPREMIRAAVREVLGSSPGRQSKDLFVEIFVPEGVEIAKKTMNARLGIVGGISILGTTGIVRPLSHEAYRATIRSALSVARATGLRNIVLTTGRRSERFAQALFNENPEEAFVQIGDYFGFSVEASIKQGLEDIVLAVFFGKAIKIAQGFHYTHAAKAQMSMERLAGWTLEATGESGLARQIRDANTARQALGLVRNDYPAVVSVVGKMMLHSARNLAGTHSSVGGVIFDYDGQVLFESVKT
ncbi:MAG: cobalamin biosynthesis protein CbiD [Desulfobacterales bacterium S5133MH4]|nr:MAG: cobalamin biosynthesis protein CbiD [Desulfobacterales bacterium S5133MH4]